MTRPLTGLKSGQWWSKQSGPSTFTIEATRFSGRGDYLLTLERVEQRGSSPLRASTLVTHHQIGQGTKTEIQPGVDTRTVPPPHPGRGSRRR
jgi:hypothetical protein